MRLSKPGSLPQITLYHNKEAYNFIVDTGSTLSWTTPEVAGKMLLGKECRPDNSVKNERLDSSIIVTLRIDPMTFTSADDLAYKFQTRLWCGEATEKINQMNVHVKEKIHGILGIDFLLHNSAKVDLDSLELKL